MARVFISYSHQDEAWKDRVVKQLGVLADDLSVWDDRQIAAGDDWQPEIEQAIADCHVALLLISADFLTSRFILGKEIPALLTRRQAEGIRVIPVILKPCQWTRIDWLKTIQAPCVRLDVASSVRSQDSNRGHEGVEMIWWGEGNRKEPVGRLDVHLSPPGAAGPTGMEYR